MADNTTPELTEQQIELGKVFYRAARYFEAALHLEFEDDKRRISYDMGQVFSSIVTDVVGVIAVDVANLGMQPITLSKAIKDGAHSYVELAAAAGNSNLIQEQDFVSQKCVDGILFHLFNDAIKYNLMPKDILEKGHPEFNNPDLPVALRRFAGLY